MASGSKIDKKLKVFLIEDARSIRSILIDILQQDDKIEVIGFADGEVDALNKLRTLEWDVAIIDIRLREGSGLGVLEGLKKDAREYGKRFVFTSNPSSALKLRTTALGAEGFFDKSRDLNLLITYLQTIASWPAAQAQPR
jgi:DNA-binding NarL/FixJ family response regulator